MQTINILSSIDGRKLLHQLFRELQFEKQKSSFSILLILWKICTHEVNTQKYSNLNISISHPLGLIKGTFLWLEEVVNRFYFSSVLSFVYFGAAFVISTIGFYRFSDNMNINWVFTSIIFEAMMLVVMFVIMLFSPKDDSYYIDDEKDEQANELITEIGELGRDLAAVIMQLEKLTDNLGQINSGQNELIKHIGQIAKSTADASSPNPAMLVQMSETNEKLADFNSVLSDLGDSLKLIKDEKLKSSVKEELHKMLFDKLS